MNQLLVLETGVGLMNRNLVEQITKMVLNKLNIQNGGKGSNNTVTFWSHLSPYPKITRSLPSDKQLVIEEKKDETTSVRFLNYMNRDQDR